MMSTEYKRMQQRYGDYDGFDDDKGNLLPCEFASVNADDPNTSDGKALYFNFGVGSTDCKRILMSGESLEDIPNGAIVADKLHTGAVTTEKLYDEAVTAEKLAAAFKQATPKITVWDYGTSQQYNFTVPLSVSGKLGDMIFVTSGTGTGGDLFILYRTVSAYGSTSYYWDNVTRLSNNEVTTAKINDSAVTTAKVADGAITSDKLSSSLQNTLDTITTFINQYNITNEET